MKGYLNAGEERMWVFEVSKARSKGGLCLLVWMILISLNFNPALLEREEAFSKVFRRAE